MRMGKSPYRAALEAADEIGLAVIAITLTIIAVFVPVSFMGGIAGQYFKQFGLVVAVAVFFSLLVARLITPLLAAYFMRDTRPRASKEGWLLRAYTRLVRWSVAHRFKTVALGLADLRRPRSAASTCCPRASCRPRTAAALLLAVELPPGSRLADTRAVDRHDRAQHPRAARTCKSVFVNGGRVLGSGAEVRKATLVINLVPKDERKLTPGPGASEEIGRGLAGVPDIRFWFLKDNGQRQFQLVVAGPRRRRRQRMPRPS